MTVPSLFDQFVPEGEPVYEGHPNQCKMPGCRNNKEKGYARCAKCRRPAEERRKKSAKKKRRRVQKNRLRAIAYLGGKCSSPTCPVGIELPPGAFDFHHRNPEEKTDEVARFHSTTWKLLQAELDKCDLLCCLCHRLHHLKIYKSDFIKREESGVNSLFDKPL